MKFKKSICAVYLVGLVLAFGLAPQAKATEAAWDTGTFVVATNLSAPLTNSYAVNTNGTTWTIQPGVPVSLTCSAQAAGAETGSLTNGFDLYNGTANNPGVWTTTQPLQLVGKLNGTTNVVFSANFTAAQLAGYTQMRWDSTGTPSDTNNITINSVGWAAYH